MESTVVKIPVSDLSVSVSSRHILLSLVAWSSLILQLRLVVVTGSDILGVRVPRLACCASGGLVVELIDKLDLGWHT